AEHTGESTGGSRRPGNPAHVGTGKKEPGSEACPRRIRSLQHNRMAERCTLLLKASCPGSRDRSYRFGYQPDGKHASDQYYRNHLFHHYLYCRTFHESGDQSSWRLCAYKPSAVRGVLRKVL